MRASALGALMRRRRAEYDLSVRGLARRLDMAPSHVSDLELGRRGPSEDTLRAILAALGIPQGEERDRWYAAAGIIPEDIRVALLAHPAAWQRVRETLARPDGAVAEREVLAAVCDAVASAARHDTALAGDRHDWDAATEADGRATGAGECARAIRAGGRRHG